MARWEPRRRQRNWGIAVALRHASVLSNTVSGNGRHGLLFFALRDSWSAPTQQAGNRSGLELNGGQKGPSRNQLVGNTANRNTQAGTCYAGNSSKERGRRQRLPRQHRQSQRSCRRNCRTGERDREQTAWQHGESEQGARHRSGQGTIDAGGTRARGNRRTPQCVGVMCR
jgi:hypothetical protein